MQHERRNVVVMIVLVLVLLGFCIGLLYHRYIIEERFDYDVKPIEMFTEDDL